jgi:hypothetical protein
MAKGYHLHTLYPVAAERPQYCGNCKNDATNHMGVSSGAWCALVDAPRLANDSCDQNAYEEREQSPEELAHLEEMAHGSAFARIRTQLLKQAAGGSRELVEFEKGIYMSPTPGKNVAPAVYPEDAA